MNARAVVTEHEWEKVRGLPGRLPADETLLWQGTPRLRGLAFRALHLRGLATYFGVLLVWRAATAGAGQIAASVLPLAALAGGVLLLLGGFAWLVSRTTVYSITDKRLVLRYGIAMPKAVNVPFSLVSNASLRLYRDGSGDIPIALEEAGRLPYLLLWPHVRPWHLSRARPMLRCIPEAAHVAQRLSRALAAATGGQAFDRPVSAPADGQAGLNGLHTAGAPA